jgi:hypothetical protein
MLPTTRRKRWIGVGDESNMWTCLVSETISIPGRDYPYPGEPNRSRVQFRPGLQSSGYKRQGFEVQGSFRLTSTSSGFRIDFFQNPQQQDFCRVLSTILQWGVSGKRFDFTPTFHRATPLDSMET